MSIQTTRNLALTASARGQWASAWAAVDQHYSGFGLGQLLSLATSGFPLDDVLDSLEGLPVYAELRQYRPVYAYWDVADPIYDLSVTPPVSLSVSPALTAYLSVPFGLAFKSLHGVHEGPFVETRPVMPILTSLAAGVVEATAVASKEFAGLVPRDGTPDAISRPVTDIILFMGLLALREYSTQLGWLRSALGWSQGLVDQVLDELPPENIEADAVTRSLFWLNEVVGFAPS